MFERTSHALAVVALVAFAGCSPIQPASPTPATPLPTTLHLNSAVVTAPFVSRLSTGYRESHRNTTITIHTAPHAQLQNQLSQGNISYFISNHLTASQALWAAPLARDGLAIITHPATSVDELTTDQLQRIYQGFITNWRDLNGSDQPIIRYGRDQSSGLQAEFERLVMGQRRLSPTIRILPSTQAMLERISSEPGAIGYIPISELTTAVQSLRIDSIAPTQANVTANQYPLRYTLYIIGQEEPTGHYRAFIGWVQSPAGQEYIIPPYAPILSQ